MVQLTRQFALFKQTIVNDTRSGGMHLLRFIFISAISVMFVLVAVQLNRWGGDIDGRFFFNVIFLINLFFVGIASLFLFLPIVREEKEENTLGMIMMTGISPFAYLTGKVGSRFFMLILMMAIQVPVTYLCVTMGGVSTDTILSTFVFLFVLAFFLSNLFVFSSLIGSSIFSCLLIASGIILAFSYLLNFTIGDIWNIRYQFEPFRMFERALKDIFNYKGLSEITIYYFISLLIGGGIFFAASVFFFNALTADQKEIELSPKLKGEKASSQKAENYEGKGAKRFYRKLKTKRFANNPIIYKDFRFTAYGPLLYLVQFVMILLPIFFFLADSLIYRSWQSFELYRFIYQLSDPDAFVFYAFILFILIMITSHLVFSQEIKNNTLSSLVLLPHQASKIFKDKTIAVIRIITPTLIMMLIILALCLAFPKSYYYYRNRMEECYFFFPLFICAYFLNSWLSMVFKRHSFFLSNGITVGFFFIVVFILEVFRIRIHNFLWELAIFAFMIAAFSYFKAVKKIKSVSLST